jgi:hypothetical protein
VGHEAIELCHRIMHGSQIDKARAWKGRRK